MLSVSFETEVCPTIKENTNEEKSFCRGKLPFCQRKLLFHWRKLRKAYFASALFLPARIEKSLFCLDTVLASQKKLELLGMESNIRMKEKYKKR